MEKRKRKREKGNITKRRGKKKAVSFYQVDETDKYMRKKNRRYNMKKIMNLIESI